MMKYIFAALLLLVGACGRGESELMESVRETEMTRPDTKARDAIGQIFKTEAPTGARLVWYEIGEGQPLIMFASAGREASDFNELAQALADAGYKSILVEAPGIGGAKAGKAAPTLFDLAQDVAPIIEQQDQGAIVLGHAFGNRLARTVATVYPGEVEGVILIAAGGKRAIDKRAMNALLASFDPALALEDRREQIRYGFFADGHVIPDYWLRGWHGQTAIMQGEATARTRSETWWAGGKGPMLVIAGMHDTIAPPQDTVDLLEADFPARVTAIRIEEAGHALLPEQPDLISEAVIAWLGELDQAKTSPIDPP